MTVIVNPFWYVVVGGIPAPASDWRFNDGSGTTITDNKGFANFTTAGTFTWGTGTGTNGATSSDTYALANTIYGGVTSYSINMWVTPVTVLDTTLRDLWAISDGLGSNNYGAHLGFESAIGAIPGVSFRVRNSGGSSTNATNAQTIDITNKWMILCRYTRTGGAADNILQLDYTMDGATWYTNTQNAGVLQQNFSNSELRDRRNNTTLSSKIVYRQSLWNSVLTNTDRDNLWSAGSEATSY